jgi:hypothetical protein
MADTTTVMALPFPEGSDANDVPADMQALAERLDEAPGIESLTSAEIAALTSGQKPAGRVVWNSTTSKLQVSNGSTFANIDAAALLLAGGTMAGNIAMGSNKVTGLAAATTNGDAVRYEQALLLAGGTMSGNIAMGGSKVTGLAAASSNGDAVRYEQLTALGVHSAWTPTLTASGSNPTASATSGENRYTQIGSQVTGVGHMQVTAAGSGTIRVPLPVTPRSSSASWMVVGQWSLVTGAGTAQETGQIVKVASQNYCHARRVPDYINTVLGQPSQDLTHSRLGDFVSAGTTYLTWTFTYEAA